LRVRITAADGVNSSGAVVLLQLRGTRFRG
jgi:hypothetical protein